MDAPVSLCVVGAHVCTQRGRQYRNDRSWGQGINSTTDGTSAVINQCDVYIFTRITSIMGLLHVAGLFLSFFYLGLIMGLIPNGNSFKFIQLPIYS